MTQDEALDILKMGHNCYLTGEAGSGKTHVLREYIEWLRERGIEPAVTASTGIAATHLGGQTIHSWSGIGIRDSLSERDIDSLEQKKSLWKRYERTHVLIIDEVSMLDAGRLDMVERLCRAFKRSEKPFGGMQVILSGDLFQLPPVVKRGEPLFYFTDSYAWRDARFVVLYLESQHRSNDRTLLSILSDMRKGILSEESRSCIEGCVASQTPEDEETTFLYTHNIDVDALNEEKLSEIGGREYSFEMRYEGNARLSESLAKGCLAPETLVLKEGALVMFVKNDTAGRYVNGTRGVVVGFEDGIPIIEATAGQEIRADRDEWRLEEDGKVKAKITQVPLRLAWAITVHKSQGMTLDGAVVDLSGSFVPGQGYVALSRVRSVSDLTIMGYNETALTVDHKVLEIDSLLRRLSKKAASRLTELSTAERRTHTIDFVKRAGGSFDSKEVERRMEEARRDTYDETKALLNDGLTIDEIAREREMSPKTIWGHLETLLERGMLPDISHITLESGKMEHARSAFENVGYERLKPVKDHLEEEGVHIGYDDLRLARLKLRRF